MQRKFRTSIECFKQEFKAWKNFQIKTAFWWIFITIYKKLVWFQADFFLVSVIGLLVFKLQYFIELYITWTSEMLANFDLYSWQFNLCLCQHECKNLWWEVLDANSVHLSFYIQLSYKNGAAVLFHHLQNLTHQANVVYLFPIYNRYSFLSSTMIP